MEIYISPRVYASSAIKKFLKSNGIKSKIKTSFMNSKSNYSVAICTTEMDNFQRDNLNNFLNNLRRRDKLIIGVTVSENL